MLSTAKATLRLLAFSGGLALILTTTAAPLRAETPETRKAVAVRAFEEILGKGNFALASELYAPDFVNHAGSGEVGLAEDQAAARGWRQAFPDMKVTVRMALPSGEYVTIFWKAEGTNSGSGNGLPATGRRVSGSGMTIWRIVGGKIREEWSVFDEAKLMQQLGLLVPAGATGK